MSLSGGLAILFSDLWFGQCKQLSRLSKVGQGFCYVSHVLMHICLQPLGKCAVVKRGVLQKGTGPRGFLQGFLG